MEGRDYSLFLWIGNSYEFLVLVLYYFLDEHQSKSLLQIRFVSVKTWDKDVIFLETAFSPTYSIFGDLVNFSSLLTSLDEWFRDFQFALLIGIDPCSACAKTKFILLFIWKTLENIVTSALSNWLWCWPELSNVHLWKHCKQQLK